MKVPILYYRINNTRAIFSTFTPRTQSKGQSILHAPQYQDTKDKQSDGMSV